jgi:2-polyprenyl-6-methoxyphenol hydroxylase-like FAD-dependent oxidoreductase
VFANVGWECPQILAAMAHVGNIYFDRVSQIRLDHWTKARMALVGDAAACVSLLAGQGSILAMAEAYVLAGELNNCGGDFDAAFTRYEQRFMPLLKRKQKSAAKFASSFAPKTAMGIAFRNMMTRLMARLPFVVEYFFGREIRDQVELPDYGL